MFDKTKIFNLALAALFLQKRLSNADSDPSTEALTLNMLWPMAWETALQEMDLDSTSTYGVLEFIAYNPDDEWSHSYKYPTDCALLRRIRSGNVTDDDMSLINKRVMISGGQKVILTDHADAEIEYITKDVPLNTLTAEAGYFIALKLATLALPLIAGTNKDKITAISDVNYQKALLAAQKKDSIETSIYQPDYAKSDLAKWRLS